MAESISTGVALSPSAREPMCCVGVPLSLVRERLCTLLPILGPRALPDELPSTICDGGSGGGFATICSPTRAILRPDLSPQPDEIRMD